MPLSDSNPKIYIKMSGKPYTKKRKLLAHVETQVFFFGRNDRALGHRKLMLARSVLVES